MAFGIAKVILEPCLIHNVFIISIQSANVEFGALQTKSPIMRSMAAIEGFEEYYKSQYHNHSFLPYNHVDEEGNPHSAPTVCLLL
jgi:hypothetical protein